MDPEHVRDVWPAVIAKLEREPIEDLRVDLEDGYGQRPDEEEDRHAMAAGHAIAAASAGDAAPPFIGIRFKSFEGGTRRRGLRSLDLVLGAVLSAGPLPGGWVVTLPKVTSVAQVAAMVAASERLERAYGWTRAPAVRDSGGTLQAILQPDGTAGVAAMVRLCRPLHRPAFRHVRLRRPWLPAGIRRGLSRGRPRQGRHALAAAGQVCGSATVRQMSSRSVTDFVHAAWALHARPCGDRWNAASIRLGPAPGSCRHVHQHVRLLLHRAGGARLGAYLHGTDSAVLDEPATARPCHLPAARRAQGRDDDEITGLTGATPTPSAAGRAGRPSGAHPNRNRFPNLCRRRNGVKRRRQRWANSTRGKRN